MNKKFYYSLIALLAVLFCTANCALAQGITFAQIKPMAVKLGLAMFAVVLFSILLSVSLSLYNKFIVSTRIKDYKINKDSLKTPSDKDEAVMMYITKNRLK